MINDKAIVDPKANLGTNVSVGPYSIIGPEVTIGDGTIIGPHVTITGPTLIGENNQILQYSSIGSNPQDLKYKGECTTLTIGDNNIIREFCSLNRGTTTGGGATKIGNNNLLMAYVHIAHDCKIGNHVIFANNTTLAGHVVIQDHALFGGFALVAQFCTIGAYSFVAATTGISKDVPPYLLVSGHHGGIATVYGLNVVGLRRQGFKRATIKKLREAYHIIFQENLTVKEALPKLKTLVPECPEVQSFIDIISKSKLGIVR